MSFENDPYVEVVSGDELRVRGTRVGVEQVLMAYRNGLLPEAIAIEYPTVGLEAVHGLIACYLRHREQLDAYLNRWLSTARQARLDQVEAEQPEVILRLRKLAAERIAS